MNKKNILFLGLMVFAGLGAAAWLVGFTSAPTGFIIQNTDGEMIFTEDFSITETNETSSIVKTETLYIENNNGVENMTVTLNTTVTDDLSDSCDPSGDATITAIYEGSEVQDGDMITIENGNSQFDLMTSMVSRSCPQEVKTIVTLEQA